MTSAEAGPNPETYREDGFVGILKIALLERLQAPMEWTSADGQTQFVADVFGDVPEPEELEAVTAYAFAQILNTWKVDCLPTVAEHDTITTRRFLLQPGTAMKVFKHEYTEEDLARLEAEKDRLVAQMIADAELQDQLGLTDPDLDDYDDLETGLNDLYREVVEDINAKAVNLQSMSREEKLLELAQQYSWLAEQEGDDSDPEKMGTVRWWGFSEGKQLHAVFAVSPDMAAALLHEYHDAPLFPVFFCDLYPEEVQEALGEKFEGREVVHLIPFSVVEWPEDLAEMTEEQHQAFEKLKNDSPRES